MVQIREINVSDAANFLVLSHCLDRESQFMMREPGERSTALPQQRELIEKALRQDNSVFLVVESEEKLVGFLCAEGGAFNRNKHSAYIVVGILQEYCGKGIGKRLFEELEARTRLKKLHRLELTVMAHNKQAISLYTKMGFSIEGTKVHSLIVNDRYVDEYYMAKLLKIEKN
ncbi:MAG: GNAT family N-acetyltransferase [bacterium]|nr:GNAT family N-acetyltransferase [bacterium]